jgi:hypothetical protein
MSAAKAEQAVPMTRTLAVSSFFIGIPRPSQAVRPIGRQLVTLGMRITTTADRDSVERRRIFPSCCEKVTDGVSVSRVPTEASLMPANRRQEDRNRSELARLCAIPPASLPFPAARLGWECSATTQTRSRKAARSRQARKGRRRSYRCNSLPSRPRLGRRNRRDCRPN